MGSGAALCEPRRGEGSGPGESRRQNLFSTRALDSSGGAGSRRPLPQVFGAPAAPGEPRHGTGAVGAARARASCLGCCSLAERARVGERLSFPPVPRKADLAALSVDQLHFPKSFVILSKFDSQTCRYFRFIIIIFFNQKFIYLFTFILENGFLSVTAFPKHC